MRLAALAGGHDAWPGADAAAATAAATAAAGHRLLLEQGGNGLSEGMVVLYIITSVVLVAVSGLMVGLQNICLAALASTCQLLRLTGSGSVLSSVQVPHHLPPPCRQGWCWDCCHWTEWTWLS